MDIINKPLNNKYPKILTPYYIKKICKKELLFEEVYPRIKRPIPPERPIDRDSTSAEVMLFFGFGFLVFIAQFFVYFFISILIGNNSIHPIVSTLMLAISVIVGGISARNFRKASKRIAANNKLHYNKKYQEYINEFDRYSSTKKEFQSSESIHTQKKEILKTELATIKKSILAQTEILENSPVKRGLTEDFFYRYLKKYSQLQVYRNLKYKFYFPDLVIIKDNLVIDLEIDEPYSYEEKKPVHHGGKDDKRDNFLLDEGFVVIHFAEEQVIENPETCLEIINNIIDSYLNLSEMRLTSKIKKFLRTTFEIENTFDLAYENSRKHTALLVEKLILKYDL